jgi:hypothetical protein
LKKIKEVKIPFSTYDVVYKKDVKDMGKILYGDIDHNCEIIRVSERFSERRQIQTIVHETLHGINFDMGLPDVEKNVEMLAGTLIYFIQHNPELIEEIQKVKG